MKHLVFLLLIILSFHRSYALEKVNETLYKYAKACPVVSAKNIKTLVSYLAKGGSTQTQKVEIFTYWIAENIKYDTESFVSGKFPATNNLLVTKKGVCEDYSKLLSEMCNTAGIECHVINGYAKGYGYTKNSSFSTTDHAWNVVKSDGKYLYIDATWASGYVEVVNGKLTFFKKLETEEIFAQPDFFLMRHLPGDPRWQLRNNPITIKSFTSKDSIADMLKLTIPKYSFQDSLNVYLKADSLERSIMTATSTYNFNPTNDNLSSLAEACYNKAWKLNITGKTAADYDTSIAWYNKSIEVYSKLKGTYATTWIANAKKGITSCQYMKNKLPEQKDKG